ncbi:MAG TPA: tetratricopeptide repeat protein [Gemmataceae bacterium]|jgi:serine/threonine protein kinase/tetratricopeptide (TPR) repeat protein|nr:tetratricopeptide repeat protein [Gemmataceae bacterium]
MPIDQHRVKELFVAAIEISDIPSRDAFLVRASAGDPELVKQVRALLQAHAAPHPAVNAPVVASELTTAHDGVGPGTIVANKYKLLQHIGEGGMGSVWMADQFGEVKRRVALKLIHSDRGSSKTILARFEAERQAIALMDHPHIAKLLDAGTTDAGMPFFAMELVKGVRLTQYCDDHKLSVPERLMLFQQICSAVQHAHQKGIIHRDLKPSNVLVESHDGKAVTKVIDFGLAKAITGQQLTEHTLFTALGQVAGTPLYMAPEQAAFNALDIDTRADIYSLGVILYELLTGSTPIERVRIKQAAFDEILRLVRESEPPIPSKRLSTTTAEPNIAVNRQLEPAKLGRFVKGELDWIVMKALAKERDRRYESASSFAKDIERFLSNEPVLAGPPSASYKIRKFMHRNRPQVVAAAVVLVALIGSVIGTTWGLIEARRQEHIAQAESIEKDKARQEAIERADGEQKEKLHAQREQQRAEKAEKEAKDRLDQVNVQKQRVEEEKQIAQAVRNFLHAKLLRQADVWVQADALARSGDLLTSVDQNITVRELLRRAADELAPEKTETNFANQPKVQAEILRTIGATYIALNDFHAAADLLQRSVDLFEKSYSPDDPATLVALESQARVFELTGKLSRAIEIYKRVRDACAKSTTPDPDLTRKAINNLGLAYLQLGQFDDAIALFHLVLKSYEEAGLRDSSTAAMNNLGVALVVKGRPRDAKRYFEEASAIDERVHPQHPQTFDTLRNLAKTEFLLGERAQAKTHMNRVRAAHGNPKLFDADHPEVLRTQSIVARMAADDGDEATAMRLLKLIQDACQRPFSQGQPDAVQLMVSVGETYLTLGRHAEAVAVLRQARDSNKETLGPDHPRTLGAGYLLAEALRRTDRADDAIALFNEIRIAREKHFPADRRTLSEVLRGLGTSYLVAHRLPEALASLEAARKCLDNSDDAEDIVAIRATYCLGVAYTLAGKPEGVPLLERAVNSLTSKLGSEQPATLAAMNDLALVYARLGKTADAAALYLQVRDAFLKLRGEDDPRTLKAEWDLAMCYRGMGRVPDAMAIFERHQQRFEASFGKDHENTLFLLNELAMYYLKMKQKKDETRRLFGELVTRMQAKYGRDDYRTLSELANLGHCHCQDQQSNVGLPLLVEAYDKGKSDARLAWVADLLIDAYAELKRPENATKVAHEALQIQMQRQKSAPGSPQMAIYLVAIGNRSLEQKRWIQAAEALRESLALHEKLVMDSGATKIVNWQVCTVKSMLGEALAGQTKFVDAELLMLAAVEGLQRDAKAGVEDAKRNLPAAIGRLISFYVATDKKDQAERWRRDLANLAGERKP